MSFFLRFLSLLCEIFTLIIIIRVILSWIIRNPDNPVWKVFFQVTEPVLYPLRRILPNLGPVDLAPLAAVVILQLVSALISYLS